MLSSQDNQGLSRQETKEYLQVGDLFNKTYIVVSYDETKLMFQFLVNIRLHKWHLQDKDDFLRVRSFWHV